MTLTQGVVLAVALLGALDLLLIGFMLVHRTVRRRLEQRLEDRRTVLRRSVLNAVLGDGSFDGTLSRTERRVLGSLADDLSEKVKGEARNELAALLAAHGASATVVRRRRGLGSERRARAIRLLGVLAPAIDGAQPAAECALGDRSSLVRATAARTLGRCGTARSVPLLIGTVDGDRSVPVTVVARAVLAIGPEAANPLRSALSEADSTGRVLAAELLGHLGSISAVPELTDALVSDPVLAVRLHAADALGRIGSPQSVPALRDALSENEPEALRVAAAVALGRVGDTGSVRELFHAAYVGPDAVARAATEALIECDDEGTEACRQLLVSGGRVADHAAAAIGLAEIKHRQIQAVV